ncbi:hypothetical protein [uncultured Rhodoblastus sp.]|uniref:hypothetical protein n=1 Tax=uncultured Rhodoblastus sp. TaxID=543037 RepID=UPI0025D39FB3|nr:hypothetical protein [uncultured Rhodoblastus sp.]
MYRKSGMVYRHQPPTITALPAILAADAPHVLDGTICNDYAFHFESREHFSAFPLHKLIGKFAVYGRLFAA